MRGYAKPYTRHTNHLGHGWYLLITNLQPDERNPDREMIFTARLRLGCVGGRNYIPLKRTKPESVSRQIQL